MKRRYSLPLGILLALALLLLLVHVALPPLLVDYLNRKMADMGEYTGHVEDVDIAWWQGSVLVEGINIEKAGDSVQVPLFAADEVDTSISWGALIRNQAIVAQMNILNPRVNIVDAGGDEQEQTGEGVNWMERLEDTMKLTLEEAHIINGQVSFRDYGAEPNVHLYASDLYLNVFNLTNTADESGRRVARLDGTAQMLDAAPTEFSASFDPFSNWNDFETQLRMTGLPLTRLNELTQAYANFDFAEGTGDLVMEAEARDGQLDGYIKPLLHNVDIFKLGQESNDDKGFFQAAWEAVVGAGSEVLENQPKDQFATRIELDGTLKNADVSPFQAFVAILRNAFVQAFTPRFEQSSEESGAD